MRNENPFESPETELAPPIPVGEDFAFYFDSSWRYFTHVWAGFSLFHLLFIGIGFLPILGLVVGITGVLRLRKPAITMNADHLITIPLIGGQQRIYLWRKLHELTSVSEDALTVKDVDGQYKDVSLTFMKAETKRNAIKEALNYYRLAKETPAE
ncbi:hypothetical protein [Acanthopleuribacter pedis]|uniref:Uncharacterized protein n=1 Tax=Acanthopleuribacter pedis TaxID=442870 RepID=A0A8J7U4B3_9BACT|nr:hypothetical protein [Acanthopleuribacter pedis]MBO1319243.1 hypothetical protein [Acanthopleuribacter pedis]